LSCGEDHPAKAARELQVGFFYGKFLDRNERLGFGHQVFHFKVFVQHLNFLLQALRLNNFAQRR
jgi:hypothetical protein